MQGPWPAPRVIQAPTATQPQRGSLFLWYTTHQATLWTPTLTPHRDAFLHLLWSGVAQYNVCEVTADKQKVRVQGRGGRTSHLDILACDRLRPAHFHSWVAGSGVQYISLICTPNHHRGKLGTLHHRVVGTGMTNNTGHRPMHSASLGHGMSSLDFGASHKVIYLIRPNTDVASISSVLHLVWPLSQSLSRMVKPTRSQNSSWHSLWGLRGTQAPQLQQSNNTLGGQMAVHMHIYVRPQDRAMGREPVGCIFSVTIAGFWAIDSAIGFWTLL